MIGQEIFSSSYDHSVLSHPCPNTGRAVCVCVCFGPDFGGTPVTTPTGWEDSVQARWGLAFHISRPACYSASATLPDTPVPAVTTPTGWEDSIQARWGLAFHNTSHTQPATVPVLPYLTHLCQLFLAAASLSGCLNTGQRARKESDIDCWYHADDRLLSLSSVFGSVSKQDTHRSAYHRGATAQRFDFTSDVPFPQIPVISTV